MDTPRYLDIDRSRLRVWLDPHEPRFVQNPYEAYAALHRLGGVFYWENYRLWCVGRFDQVSALLRDRRLGRERPGGYLASAASERDRGHLAGFDAVEANSLLELEPPAHTRLRTLVTRAFVSRQVERQRPRIETLAHGLIDGFEGSAIDLLPAFATPIPIVVISEMLGIPVDMGPQLLDWSHRMVAMYMHGRTRDSEVEADRAARAFADFLRAHVAERRGAPGDDLLSLLIAARDGGEKLSDDELVSSVILLLNAGHEATVHQIGNAVAAILAQGGDPRRFVATPDQTAATVGECLRFDAPLHMFTRYVSRQIELAPGATLEPGAQIALLLGMANRDPSAFHAPEGFLPGRPDQKNVSFGAGIHFCIGAPLARLELQVALDVLFERLPSIGLAVPPTYRDSYHFHGLERLDIRLR